MILGAIILAAGSGARFGTSMPKQFIPLNGRPVWEYAYKTIKGHVGINSVVVMFPPSVSVLNDDARVGGNTRRDSTYLGLKALLETQPDITHVLVHDAARPFLTRKIIDDCIEALNSGYDAVDVTIKSPDSIARLDASESFVEAIPDRSKMRLGQTPQCFNAKLLLQALEGAPESLPFTDDIGILLHVFPAAKVKNVEGDEENIKITTQSDLIKAERIANKMLDNPKKNLSGARAVVLGASGGIGSAVVEELRARGVTEIYTPSARNGNPSDFLKGIKDVDIVISCIGQLNRGDFLEMAKITPEAEFGSLWFDEFRINFTLQGQIFWDALHMDVVKRGGSVVFVGSSSAYHGRPGYSAYSSAKAALMNFVQSVGSEEIGVRLNLVNPGRCDTPMRQRMFGEEDKETLATPKQVASKIVDVSTLPCSGSVFDIRANELDT